MSEVNTCKTSYGQDKKKEMNKTMKVLRRLQSINNRTRQLRKDKEYRRMDVEVKQRQIQQKKAALAEKQEEIKSFQRTIDLKELDLKTKEAEIQKLRGQLNVIKTNKEYSAIVLEINGREADKSIIEDEILKMLSESESIDGRVKELTKGIDEEEKQLNEYLRVMEIEIADFDKEAETLQEDEKKFFELINEDALYHYKRLANHKDGIAVVGATNHTCLGCNMGLTSQTINLLMSEDKLVFCHNCGRILYLNEVEKE
ncbi:MAG: zinc ribbon domain-containing protein [Candidatus Brocadiales bacterium]